MTPHRLLQTAILPALDELATLGIPTSLPAARFLLAVAMQESGLLHRRQVGADGNESGPAASFWQFEQGGGCKGALSHSAVGPLMRTLCDAYNVTPSPAGLWEAMRYQDVIAAAAARLLAYTLPGSLPTNGADGWSQYVSAWRPGKPRPETWAANWAAAGAAVGVA